MGPWHQPSTIHTSPEVYDTTKSIMQLDASELKVFKKTAFPPDFNKKVDLNKVNLEVLKQHYLERCCDLMGDDDITPNWGWEMLTEHGSPNIKYFQIKMLGFLDKNAAKFSKELWALFLSAQEDPNGIPPQLLEAKKEELKKQREERLKRAEDALTRQRTESEREQDAERLRRGGREDRGRGRGAYNRGDDRRSSFGGRNDRGYEGNRGFEGRRASRDDRPNWREIDPTRRSRDGYRAEGGRRGSRGRYNDRRSRSPPRTMDSNNRRYRSRSAFRNSRQRRRNSSSSESFTRLRSTSPVRSVSRPLTGSRPTSRGPTPAESRPVSAGSAMSANSSKLSEKGKQKLADFAKEKEARRTSFSAETDGQTEGK
ncbi:hypothetical protein E6O75_ATG09637 [Venturia nashicola]|uniref:PWI domain-containing protein n=1 Tax=Venturia nashicola TaxID=86259 RepID=A0A4Z1NQB3_9PEZI|nr:hypothetical protein E6O75_ATG09637 [Venturia nashicola]